MGLFTALLTLPLAPVRGTVWIAERVAEQAERELYGETAVRRQLADLETQLQLGEIDEAQYEAAADTLLARLYDVRERPG